MFLRAVHAPMEVAPCRSRVTPDTTYRDEKTGVIHSLKKVAKLPVRRGRATGGFTFFGGRIESKGDTKGRFGLVFEVLLPNRPVPLLGNGRRPSAQKAFLRAQ